MPLELAISTSVKSSPMLHGIYRFQSNTCSNSDNNFFREGVAYFISFHIYIQMRPFTARHCSTAYCIYSNSMAACSPHLGPADSIRCITKFTIPEVPQLLSSWLLSDNNETIGLSQRGGLLHSGLVPRFLTHVAAINFNMPF